jgi:phage tail protein X
MAVTETLTVSRDGVTLDLLLWSQYRREFPGFVERTMDINPLLPRLGVVLPVGTRVLVEVPAAPETTPVRVVSLWD